MAPIRLLFLQGTLIVRSGCVLLHMARDMQEGNTMKLAAILLKISLLLALLPASAWAVSFSNLQLTTTSFSVTIEGTITGSTPSYGNDMLFIVNPSQFANPGFTIIEFAEATTKNFSGSPSLLAGPMVFGTISGFDYLYVNFAIQLHLGNPLEGTLVGSWSGNVFDPSAVTSLNFYWGNNGTGTLLGSASLSAVPDTGSSAVPDTGSTAALLGAGVAALAFARRRLG